MHEFHFAQVLRARAMLGKQVMSRTWVIQPCRQNHSSFYEWNLGSNRAQNGGNYADSGKKPEVAWKQGLRALRPSRRLAVKTNGCRKKLQDGASRY